MYKYNIYCSYYVYGLFLDFIEQKKTSFIYCCALLNKKKNTFMFKIYF